MNPIVRLKNLLDHLKTFDVWDEKHERGTVLLRIVITFFRFIRITIREFIDDRLLLKGMALTFATVLSIVPMLVISFSVFKLFGGGEWFENVVQPLILENLAPGSGPIVANRLREMISNAGSATLGGLGVMVLVLAVYGIFAGIESAFNGIWGVQFRNRGLRRLPLYWGLVTIIPILVIGSLALTTYILALPMVHEAVERISFARSLINRLLPSLMIILGFFLLYRLLPNARVRSWAAVIGALVAGTLYESLKFGVIIYTSRLVQYDFIYGSLAIIPLLLVWLNLSWFVVLLGVEVCFVSQHYKRLVHKRKRLVFSRQQRDALAYMILTEATKAFHGQRKLVSQYEWSDKYAIPIGVTSSVIERLREGGLVERVGTSGNRILLAVNPDNVTIEHIEGILGNELIEEWTWPMSNGWNWFRNWLGTRYNAFRDAAGCNTLSDLVTILEKENK